MRRDIWINHLCIARRQDICYFLPLVDRTASLQESPQTAARCTEEAQSCGTTFACFFQAETSFKKHSVFLA
jgi:hypothetical protein